MKSVRMNVTLPKDVADHLKEYGGPRGQSSFIADSVRHYIKSIKQAKLSLKLKAQYAEANEEADNFYEFDAALGDGLGDDRE